MTIGRRLSLATLIVAVSGLVFGVLSLVLLAVDVPMMFPFVVTILCAIAANCIGNLAHYINRNHNMAVLRTTRFGRALAFALLVITMFVVVMMVCFNAFSTAANTTQSASDTEQMVDIFTFLVSGMVALLVFLLSWFPGKIAVAVFRKKLDVIAEQETVAAAAEHQRFVEEKQRADAAENRRKREEEEESRRRREQALEEWQNSRK